MTHVNLPASLSVGDTLIHQKNGLYSLNDLHQSSGGDDKHKPSNFIRLDTTQALIAEGLRKQTRSKRLFTQSF